MPKRRLIGPIPRINTRRLTLFLVFLAVSAILFITPLSFNVPRAPRLSDYEQKTKTTPAIATPVVRPDEAFQSAPPSRLNRPSLQPSEAPPRQANDEYAGSSWWVDAKWLAVPYSNALTSDDRALLPPLDNRRPIYTYYDEALERPQEEKDAENALLMTWRRAWWAHGFRPIVLSAVEAMGNPKYNEVSAREMHASVKADLMRWLAWESMGGGLLAESTLLPMAAKDDTLLAHLQWWEFNELTSWHGLRGGLLAGPGFAITAGIRATLNAANIADEKTVLSTLRDDIVRILDRPSSLANYCPRTINKKYPAIAEATAKSQAAALQALNGLINAHLHVTWQNSFSRGVEILQPHPNHTTKMISEAKEIAESLLTCSESPMPSSCPPNKPKCAPCASTSKGMKIVTTPYYRNESKVFTIGVVPHPWTLTSLDLHRDTPDIAWLQRDTSRDPWVTEVTEQLVDNGIAEDLRIIRLKESIGGTQAQAQSLWLTAEDDVPEELDWHFGFILPKHRRHVAEKPLDGEDPADDPALEWILLERAKQVIAENKASEDAKVRSSIEEWNVADTEAWKFTRALQARRAMEFGDWEEEEARGRSAFSIWSSRQDATVEAGNEDI